MQRSVNKGLAEKRKTEGGDAAPAKKKRSRGIKVKPGSVRKPYRKRVPEKAAEVGEGGQYFLSMIPNWSVAQAEDFDDQNDEQDDERDEEQDEGEATEQEPHSDSDSA